MYSNIRKLKDMRATEFNSDTDRVFIGRHASAWNTLVRLQSPPVLKFAESIYYKVLEHYLLNLKAMPFTYLSQSMNKSYKTMARLTVKLHHDSSIESFDLRTFLQCLELSKSIPLTITKTERGGLMLLPGIVMQTYMNRSMRGEPVPDMQALLDGQIIGPYLSPAGISLATLPFTDDDSEQAVELAQIDQKFDTPPNTPEPVRFGTALPDQDTELHTSSTVSLSDE